MQSSSAEISGDISVDISGSMIKYDRGTAPLTATINCGLPILGSLKTGEVVHMCFGGSCVEVESRYRGLGDWYSGGGRQSGARALAQVDA